MSHCGFRSSIIGAWMLACVVATAGVSPRVAAQRPILTQDTRTRCLVVLRRVLAGDEFWPAMHAAEALTLGGETEMVRRTLEPLLETEQDDQRRCGVARELVRAGDRQKKQIMLDILASADPHGHVHAAESLYKVGEIGDGRAMRRAMAQQQNVRLQIMAAAALGRCGNPDAMALVRARLAHEDPEIRRVAAWIVGRIGDPSDVPRLRESRKLADVALSRAYIDHALAMLGDQAGLERLEKNLADKDAAIRTYAAVFAGESGARSLVPQLVKMLDDSHGDAQVRAAQALFVLAQPESSSPDQISSIVFAATDDHPRYTEGSILELADGSLLFAITQFVGGGSDFSKARIIARRSTDGGNSFKGERVLQESTGQMNVMSVTLRRLAPPHHDAIAMFYLEKNGYDDLQVHVRFSYDEARTFGDPVRVTTDDGYHVLNNDRVTQLATGRLVVPVATTPDVRKDNHFVSCCWLSDDGGRSWRKSKGQVDVPKRGAMEPGVVEFDDGRLLMIIRTQLGSIATSWSDDGGDTWDQPGRLPLTAPEAPATIRRIPATGDLVLIWNNTFQAGQGHGGRRTPLTAAVSSDRGKSWTQVRNLEVRSDRTYAYTSLAFVRDRAVMSYWEDDPSSRQYSTRFRSVPVSWFYESR